MLQLFINKLIPKRLKKSLHPVWLYSARRVAERKRWSRVGQLGYENARLYYGHDCIPGRKERSGGAIIKFQDLQEKFPNTIKDANILYLVSSAMPFFPEVMVRAAKKNGAIFVLNQNGVAYHAWHGPGWERANVSPRVILELADYVVYQSEFCKVGADKFLGPCNVPSKILHNPVDTKYFVPGRGRSPGLKILISGSHHHFYRIRTALETLKKVNEDYPEASLTIAGRYAWRPSERECLEEAGQLARELQIQEKVTFSGGYTQEEAKQIFTEHHILLHTQYNDCCPRLVVEAMACGLPVVFSKSGGVPELVGDEAGVGVPAELNWEISQPPHSKDLAKAVNKVICSLESYTRKARERAVARFDVAPWLEEHVEIFQDALQGKLRLYSRK